MTTTLDASTLNWCTNGNGTWRTIIEDISSNTTDISFSEGYTATVTGKKVTLSNNVRPTGTITFATDGENVAYVSLLASVGSTKDNLDVITGDRTDKFEKLYVNIENYPNPTTYTNGNWRGFVLSSNFTTYGTRIGYIASSPAVVSLPTTGSIANDPHMWIGVNNGGLYLVWSTSATYVPSEWYDMENGIYNLNGFKAWLADNPFEVLYKKQTATSLEDTPQEISVEDGSNFINTDNTYTSYFTSYDGTDYTIATKSARKYIKTIDGTTELVTGVSSVDVRGGRDNLIDLTRMFGATLEPGTLADFYQLFPAWNGYKLPYNKGSLLNYKGTGLKSVGFNQFTGEYSVTGKYLTVTGGYYDSTNYSVSEYIRVIPGQVYRFTAHGNAPSLCWYTYDKTFISGTNYGHAGVWQEDSFTAPANAYWVRLSVYLPRENEACFYLQWSGTRNGDYEPYWSYTRPVPTLTYFPDGMNGKGDVYDELNEKNYVKRFGIIDLSTCTWVHSVTGTYGYWTTTTVSTSIKKPASTSDSIAVVSDYYTPVTAATIAGSVDYVDTLAVATSGNILVNTGSTTQSPTGYLIYELATPVVTTFDEVPNPTAQISDYGTEESLPVNGYVPITAPFRGVVLYASDYARTITKLPENYISKESMEALMTLLGSLHNGTFTMTFNQSTNEYSFNFTYN